MAPKFSLMEQLMETRIEWPKGGYRYFIPNDSLDHLITTENVKKELAEIYPNMDKEDLTRYIHSICDSSDRTKKIFAVLVCIEQSKYIRRFVDEGITDNDLPFLRNYPDGDTWQLCQREHENCPSLDHASCGIRTMVDWRKREVSDFGRDQWLVQAPVFRASPGEPSKIPHFDLDDCVILPFIEDHEKTEKNVGGYSEVWPVRIHRAHQCLYELESEKEPRLAIKRLSMATTNEFTIERDMHLALKLLDHKHVVKLLATYKLQAKYHLIFPFADANLRQYWDRVGLPNWNRETVLWTLNQILGLASALNVIHNYGTTLPLAVEQASNSNFTRYRMATGGRLTVRKGEELFGRHGDLKPENILWSKNSKDSPLSGVLQIADLGLGRFHRLESRSNRDQKVNGSPTYAPPEVVLEKKVAREYDIWSLGCVFLEFITWMLEGSNGVYAFSEERKEKAFDDIEDDTFYTLVTVDGARDFAKVRPGVLHWISNLRQHRHCSQMVQDFLDLISIRMLMIESKDRIRSAELVATLKGILNKSTINSEYLLGRSISIMDTNAGMKIPETTNHPTEVSSHILVNTPRIQVEPP